MRQKNKYVIVCDESKKKGLNYSYFYGGAMLLESKYDRISKILNDYKSKLGFHELKRVKITEKNYKDYIEMMDLFFTFVRSGDIKVRIMFSPNDQLLKLPKSQNESYTKFYHTFITCAFNIFYAKENINLRLIFDDLPETKEQCKKFKQCLLKSINFNNKPNTNKAFLKKEQIEEVDSRKHIILQCVDVVVGLVDFALNTTKKELKESKRAKAKLCVWNKVYSNIKEIHPNFILVRTTGMIYSHKGWINKYAHFVYHKKNSPQYF